MISAHAQAHASQLQSERCEGFKANSTRRAEAHVGQLAHAPTTLDSRTSFAPRACERISDAESADAAATRTALRRAAQAARASATTTLLLHTRPAKTKLAVDGWHVGRADTADFNRWSKASAHFLARSARLKCALGRRRRSRLTRV
eukprot:6194934-Pleurochrysis_carterae.AAC.2